VPRWLPTLFVVLAAMPLSVRAQDAPVTPPLVAAAARGDLPAVSRLLRDGAPVNATDERGRTAVLAATHADRPDIVQVLLQAGADVDLRDNRSDNAFLYAGAQGQLAILRLVIRAGADPRLTNRFGGTALIPAAERGHVEVVRELLTRSKVDVNHVNDLGWTALLEAIVLSNGGPRHQQVVALLLAHGADASIADKEGVTPLAHARRRGYGEIERLLTQAWAR
jgi:ankyrin repeat protein